MKKESKIAKRKIERRKEFRFFQEDRRKYMGNLTPEGAFVVLCVIGMLLSLCGLGIYLIG